jgi:DNA-directed RNA polymerase subunit RPC12/RpoP
MAVPGEDELTCTDCGVKITGVPVVPSTGEGPTQAQIEKLKPTVYLCTECAKERGLSFNGTAIGRTGKDAPPLAP